MTSLSMNRSRVLAYARDLPSTSPRPAATCGAPNRAFKLKQRIGGLMTRESELVSFENRQLFQPKQKINTEAQC
jgi:hypothetical protein